MNRGARAGWTLECGWGAGQRRTSPLPELGKFLFLAPK